MIQVHTPLKKKRIVIASVLKPVDDTRMFEKMANTLCDEAEIHIIGFPSEREPDNSNILFHCLYPFKRLSIARFLSPWKILRLIFEIKPSVLIITTHELLLVGILAKFFLSCKLIYDVRENYFLNILHTNAFPYLLRPFIAASVRIKEWITSPFVNHFLLAERGYEKELAFPRNRKTIIENKTIRQSVPIAIGASLKENDGCIHLLFTGTLAETTGVFTAIELTKKLHHVNPSIRLTIIGYCSLPITLRKIRDEIKDQYFIELIGGDRLVPHVEIVRAIQSADFGIIAYSENPSIINSMPTKLYEYLAYKLPILMVDFKPWLDVAQPFQAAIPFNLSNVKPNDVLVQMKNQVFYNSTPENVFWESEAGKLKKIVLSNIP